MKTVNRMSGPNKNPIEAAAPGRDLCLDFRRAPIQTVLSYIHIAVGLKIAVESNVEIERLIKAHIPDAEVTIRDLAGDGDHYAATVIAPSFKGKSRVQQHQLVYEALKGQMGGVLHALALQTGTP